MGLFLVLALLQPQTFTFRTQGKAVEGYLAVPSAQPKALILYFHRAIEDRNAVVTWGEMLTKDDYAIAGYTADQNLDAKQEALDLFASLHSQKRFAGIPMIAMGASLGTEAAAALFAQNEKLNALVLMVPTSTEVCDAFHKANHRSVLLIQAANDDIAGANAVPIRKCLPATGTSIVLPDTPHRFPPSMVYPKILAWLKQSLK